MDKYEFKLKVDEMKALVSARNYNAAAEIAETINWRKIRNLNALVLAGEVFEQVGRYEDSKEILLMAYDKSPIGRNIIYRLAEISIKTKRFDEAQEYYDEFVDIAPHDNLKFVLKYKMTAAQGLPYKEQIKILEELKEQEYSEEWAYELAYLYYKDMQPEKCVEACDELILWFGDGIYVEKALELKMHYQPLTKPQEDKYRMFRQKRTGVIEVRPNDFFESGEIVHEAVQIPSVQTNTGQYNTANLQEEIARGMQQISTVRENVQEQPIQQNAYMGQMFQPDSYEMDQMQTNPYIEEQMQQEQLQPSNNSYLQQEVEWKTLQEQEPAPAMTMEEIQAEWEKTKQAMNDALYEAKESEKEASKEKSLVRAEQLMQQLLGIIPQLAEKTEQQLPDKNSGKVQNDLEQAGKIVAGINQLLQEQIDRLQAKEEKKQDSVIQKVSDPTREMPQLPENMVEGKEIGAIDKVKMNGNSLKKVSSKEDDNPVMSAWKEAPPGISALDLLQRVRMEKTAASVAEQVESPENLNMQNNYSVQYSNVEAAKTEESLDMPSAYMKQDLSTQKGYGAEQTVMEAEYSVEQTAMEAEHAPEQTAMEAEHAPEQTAMEAEYLAEHAGMQTADVTENTDVRTDYWAENTHMQTADATENTHKEAEYFVKQASIEENPAENKSIEAGNAANNMYMQSELSQESVSVEEGEKYDDNLNISLENKERNAEPKFESEQENLFLAAKPRFLTQAQLQSESVMDGKKNTQVTKEFSKEAMAAARSVGFQENIPLADDLNRLQEMKKLTEEQKQIFSYFVPIAGMEAQIYDLLAGVSSHLQYDKHALSGNIIIEGISGSGKTVLIMDIIKVLQKEIKRPVGKTGKIDANALNQKDLNVLIEKISGGCLIIESAGKISRETAVKLSACMEKDHAGTLYIIEDTEEGIQKALERDSSFAAKFTEKISIPLFSSDELVEFGKAYANDLNYDIDEMGVLALYKRISAIQKLDHVTTLTEVKEIVDEAIDNAEKGVLKKVFGMLTATRANDDNYIILREKDFEE